MPARPTFRPALFKIWYIKVAVVVFPLDPVTAIINASVNLLANSISEINFLLSISG